MALLDLVGRPAVLEERLFGPFPSADPAWEGRYAETTSRARFCCSYLNAEELPGQAEWLWTAVAAVDGCRLSVPTSRYTWALIERRRTPWTSPHPARWRTT